MSRRSQRYPPEIRERAIRLVGEDRGQHVSEWAAIESVAAKLGIGSSETLRKWIRAAEVDAGRRPGVSTEESVAFIARHADRVSVDGLRWGVEPICRVLTEHDVKIAPSTYYDAVRRGRAVNEQDLREERLMLAIARVHHQNCSVYGARKVWLALNREGIAVARCTVERLMAVLGLRGARRGRVIRTTRPDPAAGGPADLVERNFNPARPDALWVADYTYVSTWAGMVYVAFVLDAFSRRIVGWRAAASMRTELVLDALEMAIWTRQQAGVADLTGLVHHTDAGAQYTSIRFTERLAEAGATPSVGDAYDNALAETEVGLFKTELIHRHGPWRGLDAVEIATLEWVEWHNHRRLHSACSDLTPVEYEQVHYRQHPALTEALVPTSSPDTPGRFSPPSPHDPDAAQAQGPSARQTP